MVQDEVENAAFAEKTSKRKTLKELRKAAAAAANTTKSSSETIAKKESEEQNIEIVGEAEWGGIKLHILLQKALISLNFKLPTPIQTAAIPIVATGKFDLVGAAETGSGAYSSIPLSVRKTKSHCLCIWLCLYLQQSCTAGWHVQYVDVECREGKGGVAV